MNNSGAAEIGEQNEPNESEVIKLRTAFVVFQDENGQWGASNKPEFLGERLGITKVAHPDEMIGGCAAVQAQIAASITATVSEQRMMARADLIQEQATNAALRQKLKV